MTDMPTSIEFKSVDEIRQFLEGLKSLNEVGCNIPTDTLEKALHAYDARVAARKEAESQAVA